MAAAVAGGVGVAAAVLLAVREYLRHRAYDGLDSVVSFSARIIAGARAEESERPDAFFKDPLAAVLAGKKALKDRKAALSKPRQGQLEAGPAAAASSGSTAAAAASAKDTAAAASSGAPAARTVSRIVMRTVFFDHAIQTAAGGSAPEMFKGLQAALGSCTCTQVVLLGSGMDTRPWRLALPEAIAWFEVDMADVLRAKRRLLQRSGAAFVAGPGSRRPAKYPLCCSSWAGVSLDLQQAGWTKQLLASGFSTSEPTVWVLEGLLYYLEPETVPPMLQEAASVSAPGSALVASIVSAEFVEELKQREVYQRKDNIMSGWKWGCPVDPGQYFGDNGWRVLSSPTWVEAAQVYGYEADMPLRKAAATAAPGAGAGAGKGGASEQRVRCVTAVLK